MPTLFVDSSALVKRYRQEAGSVRVSDLLENAERLLIARLTIVEVSSALVRRARVTTSFVDQVTMTIAALDDEVRQSFDVVELDEPVMAQAVSLPRKYSLRGADAVQLACTLMAKTDELNFELVLVSSDAELNAAAIAEGLNVENPNPPDP